MLLATLSMILGKNKYETKYLDIMGIDSVQASMLSYVVTSNI
ncbi:MAG: hypothetical protein PT120_21685 [Aphanizomenon gracile PMC649.10]|nr:hypothetical protein [Dolichospermum sp. LEGE 00240]MDM3846359.1 hypothetical protein [Aphanizomenon gracile PMC638.10]MDM3852893.1 hypothetical protein [Aphanizomenon gracile PMC627.10]MDM3857427.1 hypothetical protein [Aphanizomenon gracile PMC649.10]MDM3860930.1 hypothetical protein [Aphanizomenon gracile PMC644.10]